MTNDHVFGSDKLTPELLRSVQFDEQDGKVDVAEVRLFLDRVASSLDVFLAGDEQKAIMAEFQRGANVAEGVLEAGQVAADQLRRQAAEEAKRILDEARDATLGLRETVEAEIGQAREQVESMRGTFIQDLRDLYDRIGASLYRFERAAEESRVEPIREPSPAPQSTFAAEPGPAEPATAPAPASEPAPEPAAPAAPAAAQDADVGLPEGAKPPAWRQLPPEAWSAGADEGDAADDGMVAAGSTLEPEPEPEPATATEPAPAPAATPAPTDPFAVQEDDPLAPGEPLVDLRGFADTVASTPAVEAPATPDAAAGAEPTSPDLEAVSHGAEPEGPLEPTLPAEQPEASGGSWLDGGEALEDVPPLAPQAATAAAPDETASPAADAGGSWLDAPATEPAAAAPDVARDDALAEALIAGDGPAPIPAPILDPSPEPGAAAEPAAVDASPDSLELRGTILELSAAGHSREAIATYLKEQLNVPLPEPFIKATLGDDSAGQPS